MHESFINDSLANLLAQLGDDGGAKISLISHVLGFVYEDLKNLGYFLIILLRVQLL